MSEQLSPLERDVVDLLQEEGSEVLLELVPILMAAALGRVGKVASKVKRFGNVQNPFAPDAKPNFELLEEEIGDFQALVDILVERGVLSKERITQRVDWKRGMLTTHGSIDWSKDDQRTPPEPVKFGGYVNKAPYQEMRLRMLLTGTNAPTEQDWVAALKRLLKALDEPDFLYRVTPKRRQLRCQTVVRPRSDGGIRILGFEELQGLHLAGPDGQEVMRQALHAMKTLLEANGHGRVHHISAVPGMHGPFGPQYYDIEFEDFEPDA